MRPIMYHMLFVCLFLFSYVHANQNHRDLSKQPVSVVGEVAPCSFVNESVNVVDGSLNLQFHQMTVPGHVPLDVVLYYNNKSRYTNWFGIGMCLNYSFSAWTGSPGHKKKDKHKEYNETLAESAGGSIIRCLGKFKEDKKANYFLDPEVVKDGFTNCNSGQISARTNLKNIKFTQFTDNDGYSDWVCYLPDGTERKYHPVYHDPHTHVYLESRLNGTKLLYDYHEYVEKAEGIPRKKVDSIKGIKAKGKNTLNWLSFSDHDYTAKITSSSGKTVRLKAFDNDYISSIESSENPTLNFSYKDVGDHTCISKLSWPHGRFLEIEYDKKARVTAQKAPVGKDKTPHTIYSFEYSSDKTIVTDANKHKKRFTHKNDRIISIEDLEDSSSYRATRYFWGTTHGHSWKKPPTGDKGNLLGYATLNHEGCGVQLCTYTYDNFGNIITESLSGNLSGKYPWAFWIDDDARPKDPNIEQYNKYYSYSDKHLMLSQKEDHGPSYEFRYKSNTDLIWAKFTKDNEKIILREFYEYDDNGILIEKIVDDGNTDNKSCLSGVTERHITKIKPTLDDKGKGHGLPREVTEYYYDFDANDLKQLKRTYYNYNNASQVTEEAVFDADDAYRFSTWYEYNHKDLLYKETNPAGQTKVYTYDENNNKTQETQENVDFSTNYEYDYANRCTAVVEHHKQADIRSSFEYDFMGNKTASIDRYGQKTCYEYDSCNRVNKITFPDGTTILKEYDIFDNVIRETNQNGSVTTFAYTIRNAPSHIVHPDGSEERFEYNKNGTLAHKWDQSGTKTSYEYDILGRITETSMFDAAGNILSSTSNSYNSFHLLSTTDAMGYTTHYKYDQAGRKIEEHKEDESNYSKTTFEYDALGRMCCTKKHFDDANFIATYIEYDNLNRITLESTKDINGRCTSWNYYAYDLQGNCTLKRTGHLEEKNDADINYTYNTKCELIALTDECGSKTEYTYNHGFINKNGQNILQKITTDALENSTEEYYDISGRLVSILKKNPQGDLTAITDLYYNGTGKKTKQIEKVIIDGKIDHDYTISWNYDSVDRVKELIKQPDTDDRKVTSYTYDPCGRVQTITKPDGTIIYHTYDALGRLTELNSSDKTVSYSYTYDLHNNPLQVKDNISGLITKRTYDAWDRLIEDGIVDIHAISYSYDALGRPLTLSISDNSSIHYTYDNAYLNTIQRFASDGSFLYEHAYLSFDKKGRVLESALINNLGNASFTYDKKGRNTTATTNYHSHSIPEDGFDAVGNLKKYKCSDPVGSLSLTYSYDDLYQLTQESGLQEHTYTHDSIHNRLSKNNASLSIDPLNKISSDGIQPFTYDKNGNLISDGQLTYRYDALDRLIEANGTHYVYDSFNRRIKKNDTYYLHQNLREIGSLQNGKIQEFRVLGLGKGAELGASIAIELENNVYCPIHDFRGNIVTLIDTKTQKPAETYRYTAFGECEVVNHHSLPHNPWRFASKRYDPETGFTYFLRRYYNPNLGRWITPDPIGFADGPNIYAYVHNNPMTMFDLYGLFTYEDGETLEAAGLFGMLEVSGRTILDMTSFAAQVFRINTLYEKSQEWHTRLDEFRNSYVKTVADHSNGRVTERDLHQAIDTGSAAREMFDFSRMAINGVKLALKGGGTLRALQKEGRVLEKGSGIKASQGYQGTSAGNKLPKDHMWTKSSPFKDKNADELHAMFIKKKFDPIGPDPKNGIGNYINPKNGRKYHIDPENVGRYREPNHIDVSRLDGYTGSLEKKRFKYKDD